MRYEFIAIRDQLVEDVKAAWFAGTPGAKVHVRRVQREHDPIPAASVALLGPITREDGNSTMDRLKANFEVCGVFRDDHGSDVDWESVSLAGLLRNQIYTTGASPNPYGGYGFLLYVEELLGDEKEPGDEFFTVSLRVSVCFLAQRNVTGYPALVEASPLP